MESSVCLDVSEAVCGQSGREVLGNLFGQLREAFGVAHDRLAFLFGHVADLEAKNSAGKGGAIFVRSKKSDDLFVKSLNKREATFLSTEFGQAYFSHCVDSATSTLLMRIVGFFVTQNNLSFVVVKNVFSDRRQPIDCVFDLKGSIVNRTAQSVEGTQLDCNWIDRGAHLYISHATAKRFRDALRRDAEFLAAHNLMDYSLLVGFEFVHPDAIIEESVCLMRSEDRVVVYHVGIIDFLQEYNFKKKAARAIKSLFRDASTISTIDSQSYCTRFVNFINAKCFVLSLTIDGAEGDFDDAEYLI